MKPTRLLPALAVLALALGGCKKDDKKSSTEKEVEEEVEKGKTETPVEPSGPKVKAEEVTYSAGSTILKGYLAYDENKVGKRPGVLVVHEWWGHNDYARMRARKLAEMGYTALAVDMYGDGKQAAHPKDAMAFMTAVFENMDEGVARFDAAKALLEKHATTDETKTAAIGYCFGGAVVLHMARTGSDLDAVASFHGNLSTKSPAEKDAIKAKILVAHGAADGFVPPEQVDAFKKEMEAAGADLRFEAYEGAKHSFTNPGSTEVGKKFDMPLAYDKDADEKSWAALGELLTAAFAD